MKIPYSQQEAADTLTGFDEIAIAKAFGKNIQQLSGDQTQLIRAVVFVFARRDGMNNTDAYQLAQGSTGAEIQAFFPDVEAGDELGEDEGQTKTLPSISLGGAESPDSQPASTSD